MTWLAILRRVLDIAAGLIADLRASRERAAGRAEAQAAADREIADGLEKIARARAATDRAFTDRAAAAGGDDPAAGGLHDDDGFRRD